MVVLLVFLTCAYQTGDLAGADTQYTPPHKKLQQWRAGAEQGYQPVRFLPTRSDTAGM